MGAYRKYIGKYVYILIDYEEDFPEYIGMTNNFVRRSVEHIGCSCGTKFADNIPKHLRKTRYRMMVFDFSKPKKLSKKEKLRLKAILKIIGNVKAKPYDAIKQEKLKEAGKIRDLDWF